MPVDYVYTVSTAVRVERSCSECPHKWSSLESVQHIEKHSLLSAKEELMRQRLAKEVEAYLADYTHHATCPRCGALSREAVSAYFSDGYFPRIRHCIKKERMRPIYGIMAFCAAALIAILVWEFVFNSGAFASTWYIVLSGSGFFACVAAVIYEHARITRLDAENPSLTESLAKDFFTARARLNGGTLSWGICSNEVPQYAKAVNAATRGTQEGTPLLEDSGTKSETTQFSPSKTLDDRLAGWWVSAKRLKKLSVWLVAAIYLIGVPVFLLSDTSRYPDHLNLFFWISYSISALFAIIAYVAQKYERKNK